MIRKRKFELVVQDDGKEKKEKTPKVSNSPKNPAPYDKSHHREPKPARSLERSLNMSRIGNGLGSFVGFFAGGLSIFLGLYLIISLNRAYLGLPFVGVKQFLDVFSTDRTLTSPFQNWLAFCSNGLWDLQKYVTLTGRLESAYSNFVAQYGSTAKTDVLVGILHGITGLMDVFLNIFNILILVTQGVITIISFFSNIILVLGDLLTGISRLTSMSTEGNALNDARDQLWNSLIACGLC